MKLFRQYDSRQAQILNQLQSVQHEKQQLDAHQKLGHGKKQEIQNHHSFIHSTSEAFSISLSSSGKESITTLSGHSGKRNEQLFQTDNEQTPPSKPARKIDHRSEIQKVQEQSYFETEVERQSEKSSPYFDGFETTTQYKHSDTKSMPTNSYDSIDINYSQSLHIQELKKIDRLPHQPQRNSHVILHSRNELEQSTEIRKPERKKAQGRTKEKSLQRITQGMKSFQQIDPDSMEQNQNYTHDLNTNNSLNFRESVDKSIELPNIHQRKSRGNEGRKRNTTKKKSRKPEAAHLSPSSIVHKKMAPIDETYTATDNQPTSYIHQYHAHGPTINNYYYLQELYEKEKITSIPENLQLRQSSYSSQNFPAGGNPMIGSYIFHPQAHTYNHLPIHLRSTSGSLLGSSCGDLMTFPADTLCSTSRRESHLSLYLQSITGGQTQIGSDERLTDVVYAPNINENSKTKETKAKPLNLSQTRGRLLSKLQEQTQLYQQYMKDHDLSIE